ncbi:ANTAR domain-containing protein [Kribbella sp. NPDC049174]|uniref:ANTAR domain-containing protein n=1 Tax=Kribbella sp. NPDC049174 TaxID=3364112 RepID=UPI00371920F0
MIRTDSGGVHATAAALADLARELHAIADLDPLLERAVECTRSTLTCDCAGIVVLAGHGIDQRRITGSDDRIVEADRLRQVLGEGPDDTPLPTEVIRDTESETRWPQWAPRVAAQLGLRSAVSVGLPGQLHLRGALTMYATRPDAFTTSDQALAKALAAHVAVAVTAVVTARSLERAIDARAEVGRAVGVLMERFGISAGEAFARLRRDSQIHHVRLRTVAAELLNERPSAGQRLTA